MPFARPTLSELRADAAADLSANLSGADALLRFSNLYVLGTMLAGMMHEQYGYLDWISKQAVPFTATDEYLEAWAGLKGVIRESATAAKGVVTFVCSSAATIPAGWVMLRSDGAEFTADTGGSIADAGSLAVDVTASIAGTGGNTAVNALLTFSSPRPGAASAGTVTTAISGGIDTEADNSLRSRMLAVYAAPPAGGNQDDYVNWARSVPGVTRAWCEPNGGGAGTVYVYFMMDVTESAFNGFPQGTDGVAADEVRDTAAVGDQLTVADYIFPLRPVTALVYAKAPAANTVAFTISGLSTAGSTIQNEVKTAIDDVFLLKGSPGGTVDLSDLNAAIAAIAGTAGFVITTPSANISSAAGHLPVRGVVTWS